MDSVHIRTIDHMKRSKPLVNILVPKEKSLSKYFSFNKTKTKKPHKLSVDFFYLEDNKEDFVVFFGVQKEIQLETHRKHLNMLIWRKRRKEN